MLPKSMLFALMKLPWNLSLLTDWLASHVVFFPKRDNAISSTEATCIWCGHEWGRGSIYPRKATISKPSTFEIQKICRNGDCVFSTTTSRHIYLNFVPYRGNYPLGNQWCAFFNYLVEVKELPENFPVTLKNTEVYAIFDDFVELLGDKSELWYPGVEKNHQSVRLGLNLLEKFIHRFEEYAYIEPTGINYENPKLTIRNVSNANRPSKDDVALTISRGALRPFVDCVFLDDLLIPAYSEEFKNYVVSNFPQSAFPTAILSTSTTDIPSTSTIAISSSSNTQSRFNQIPTPIPTPIHTSSSSTTFHSRPRSTCAPYSRPQDKNQPPHVVTASKLWCEYCREWGHRKINCPKL